MSEHLWARSLAHRYLGSALKVFWHHPVLLKGLPMLCPHRALNQQPSASQPSLQQTDESIFDENCVRVAISWPVLEQHFLSFEKQVWVTLSCPVSGYQLW